MQTLELSLWLPEQADFIRDFDNSINLDQPLKYKDLYWSVTGYGSVVATESGLRHDYIIKGGFESLDEWEQAFKPIKASKPFGLMENKPDVIYIAGAISGEVESNRHKFMAAKHRILASTNKAIILSTADLPTGLSEAQYMSICLPMVMASDTIFMLDGWERSPGASAEFALAKKLNLKIVYEGEYELSE